MGDKLRSFDYVHEYENNEYTKEGYFNRLITGFGDETVLCHNSFRENYGMQSLLQSFAPLVL